MGDSLWALSGSNPVSETLPFNALPSGRREIASAESQYPRFGTMASYWTFETITATQAIVGVIEESGTSTQGRSRKEGHAIRCVSDTSGGTCIAPTLDGYTYDFGIFDGKCWLTEDLRTQVLQDGTEIPHTLS